jgi:hypothetical protein
MHNAYLYGQRYALLPTPHLYTLGKRHNNLFASLNAKAQAALTQGKCSRTVINPYT